MSKLNMQAMTEDTLRAHAALLSAFAAQYLRLSRDEQALVIADFSDANKKEGISASEYRARIDQASLASYVACLKVQS
jgi:hypothetical protein